MDGMSYDGFIAELSGRVQALAPPPRAAVFWLAGTSLRAGLSEPEATQWTSWMTEASEAAVGFIVDGRVEARLQRMWEQASTPTGTDTTQLLNSVIVCLSSPLAIAIEPGRTVGSWIEHALFPAVQEVSLDLFDDVAFPDDEGLEEVFADGRVVAACDDLVSICGRLEESPQVRRETLDNLLEGSGVLLGVSGRERPLG